MPSVKQFLWLDLKISLFKVHDEFLPLSLSQFERNGNIKWILNKYETWFDSFLAFFMSGYKWDKRDLEELSFKANQVLHQLILAVMGKVTLGGHLYTLISKAKKKSNRVSYLVSIHLIFLLHFIYELDKWDLKPRLM